VLQLIIGLGEIILKATYPVLVAIILSLSGMSFADTTSIFYKGGVLSLEQPTIKINKIYGIKLSPVDVTVESKEKEIFIPHSIENLSNTTNVINLEIESVTSGWTAELVRNENKIFGKTQELGEGAFLHFFVKLTPPDSASKGYSGSAVIKASCLVKDGAGYTGDNGIKYGGEDEVETTDTVIVK